MRRKTDRSRLGLPLAIVAPATHVAVIPKPAVVIVAGADLVEDPGQAALYLEKIEEEGPVIDPPALQLPGR